MKKPIIGSIEHVQISIHGDDFVLAKIDTGADSSSIWATNISQEDGRLSYTFFGPGSTYYTGAVHKTKRYKITTVKNSFGHSEVRYKVYLATKVGELPLKGWFTLSDRSRNRYPILLGKSLLKNSFLVDVSQNHIHSEGKDVKKVLVVSAGAKTEPFLRNVEQHLSDTITLEASRFKDMLFDINGDLTEITDIRSGLPLSRYDLVYIKSHWNFPEPASALVEFFLFKNKTILDGELEQYTSRSKLSETMKLSLHGIPVPRSFVGFKEVLMEKKQDISDELGFPLILKNTTADRGKDNFYVEDMATLELLLSNIQDNDVYMAQKYVENDGFYRINIFGVEVGTTIFRKAHTHTVATKKHLNKPSGGVNAELIDIKLLSTTAQEIAVRAAICMDRQVAGVDILQHNGTGEWYVLEVNNSPQLRTGAFVDEKTKEFAKFIERKLEK